MGSTLGQAGLDEIVAAFSGGDTSASIKAWMESHPEKELLLGVVKEFALQRRSGQTNRSWGWFHRVVMVGRFGSPSQTEDPIRRYAAVLLRGGR